MNEFFFEKGNWYNASKDAWMDYGIFRQGEKTPFAMAIDEEHAELIVSKLNEQYENGNIPDDIGRIE